MISQQVVEGPRRTASTCLAVVCGQAETPHPTRKRPDARRLA